MGFSVYPVLVPDFYPPKNEWVDEFKCHYRFKISNDLRDEKVKLLTKTDVNNKVCDIFFDEDVLVRANCPICIMVRYTIDDNWACQTLLGYGGENYKTIGTNE